MFSKDDARNHLAGHTNGDTLDLGDSQARGPTPLSLVTEAGDNQMALSVDLPTLASPPTGSSISITPVVPNLMTTAPSQLQTDSNDRVDEPYADIPVGSKHSTTPLVQADSTTNANDADLLANDAYNFQLAENSMRTEKTNQDISPPDPYETDRSTPSAHFISSPTTTHSPHSSPLLPSRRPTGLSSGPASVPDGEHNLASRKSVIAIDDVISCNSTSYTTEALGVVTAVPFKPQEFSQAGAVLGC